MEEVSKAREGRRKSDARKHEGRAWKRMARSTQVNHCGDRECHETTLNLNSQSDHVQNTVHSWYLLFSFCPMMSFVQKKKTKQQQQQQQKNEKVKGRLVSKQNTHSFCFFVTFLFGILQHLFIFGFLGIKVQQPLLSCTVYTTIIRFWLQINRFALSLNYIPC